MPWEVWHSVRKPALLCQPSRDSRSPGTSRRTFSVTPWKPFPTVSDTERQPLVVLRHSRAALPLANLIWTHAETWLLGNIGGKGLKVLSKASTFHLLVARKKKKMDAFSLPPAQQLLPVRTAIEKLTSSKQNKWQNFTKGGEWTRPNGAVFEEALPVGPLPPQQGKAEKRGPWYGSLLGNWGSYVWNAPLYASVVSHPASPLAIGHAICLCSQRLSYVFPFPWRQKRCGALGAEQRAHILSVSVKLLSNCCRAAGGADICFSPVAGCRPCRPQSPGMPHTFCLFYMSKQIVNWLIIFVLTMSFTAVSLLSALFALFKYEASGPPLRRSLLH